MAFVRKIEKVQPGLQGGWGTDQPVQFNGPVTFAGARLGAVNGSSGNTTLLASGSGATYLFDTAAGITYTLPAPVVGATYGFIVTTSVTSSNHKVITNTGSVLLQGTILGATTTASMFESVPASSNISVTMNGTTTGGLIGTELTFRCLSSTLWQVTGNNFGSGSPATPFANT